MRSTPGLRVRWRASRLRTCGRRTSRKPTHLRASVGLTGAIDSDAHERADLGVVQTPSGAAHMAGTRLIERVNGTGGSLISPRRIPGRGARGGSASTTQPAVFAFR